MKKIEPFLPVILISLAGIAAVYFFWYKPQRDKKAVEDAAKQAAFDQQLLQEVEDPFLKKLQKGITSQSTATSKAISNLL